MATHGDLPTRTNTTGTGYTSDDDLAGANDPSSTTGLLQERLQAWKHMCRYLEDYVSAVAKDQKSQAKDQEKILKTLSNPLKEGHHFDQSLGGVAGLFENLRANTQGQINLHHETEKNLTGSVLPTLERLHSEIKNKRKELDKGAGKATKEVEAARNSSQKHIELLGQYTATFDSSGGKVAASNDPYVLQRGVWHRLNKQLAEENNNRSDLLAVQDSFRQFEAHIIQSVQTTLNTFNQYMAGQAERQKAYYGDIAGTAARIPADFEWNGFIQRHGHVLISPNAPAKSIDAVTFPNLNHRATKALIEGSLERKSRGLGGLGGYKSEYYAVTPAGYMHEYKDNDNFNSDPNPETSLYLPDCVIGAVDGTKFSIKGKDTSGGKLSQKMSMSSEYNFKAHTPADAVQWHSVIASVTGGASHSLPNSPVDNRHAASATAMGAAPIGTEHHQTTGVVPPQSGHAAAPGAVPQSATATHMPQHDAYAQQQPMTTAHPQQGAYAQQQPMTTAPPQQAAYTQPHPQQQPMTTAQPQMTGAAPTTTAASVAGTHYHGQPGTSELEPRRY